VERYSGLVWSICRACGLNAADAAEVSQTTWLRLVQHLASLRDPERIGSWLSMTARREAWRVHRQSARALPVEAIDQFDAGDASGDEVDRGLLDAERRDGLREAFRSLPPRCQQVLQLLMSDPAPSYVEVAAALDMPVGSIGPTRGRCLACLRDRAAELTRG
jgi:RNA polymerase sigma factor (sigma-70 family)